MGEAPKHYLFDHIRLRDGWHSEVQVTVSPDGMIHGLLFGDMVVEDVCERVSGYAVPGMANVHSHAFQRAMAGLAETAGSSGEGDFWSWRKVMYGFLDSLGPEDVQAIAAQLYVEMLKGGYTSVGEFHYLHQQPNGQAYDNPAEMSQRIMQAASTAGIGLCLLPVLYQTANLQGGELEGPQKRFYHETAAFQALLEQCCDSICVHDNQRVGLAFHSLRAVPELAMRQCLSSTGEVVIDAPVHIHVAEQQQEVDEVLSVTGTRPIRYLLDHFDLDERWCLVHATHMDWEECRDMAVSGAVAGLCPTTEANLGDGFFEIANFSAHGGHWGVGSDSHVSTSPAEELRLLDYGMRLREGKRVSGIIDGNIGAGLWLQGAEYGARAIGFKSGVLHPGHRADVLVLDPDHPALVGRQGDRILDSLVFAGHGNPVRDVMVAGDWCVIGGRHTREDEVLAAYQSSVKNLKNSI